ncbi:MAG: PKD domain-containing protein [Bacteroidales bacterium]|nr:PKD domain-containing protein [Bacteroidales bacterium]
MKKLIYITFAIICMNGWLPFHAAAQITLDLKVYLEGPFTGDDMNTFLNNNGYLPLNHPYNQAPWYHNGPDQVVSIPNNEVVDWVLVELREAPGGPETATPATVIDRMTCFIFYDGVITGLDGVSPPQFTGHNITQNLYVVVWHRNHLGLLSNFPLTLSNGIYAYDFTDAPDKAYGGTMAHKQVNGYWVMAGGDGNADCTVNNTDKLEVWKPQAGLSGYLAGDFTMNGYVDNNDKIDIWYPNAGLASQVPVNLLNTPPVAEFTVTPQTGNTTTIFSFDGSMSTDPEDPPEALRVRWDFDGDGIWESGWSMTKTATWQYDQPGVYIGMMQVMDSGGLIGTDTTAVAVIQWWSCSDPVTDIDGNVYNTVLIGSQCWMKENLKTTTYKNGASIPNVTNGYNWSNLTTGAYVWYDNNIIWKDKYGALYNWYATVDPNGLCPSGWHVPTHNEWTALTDHIGGTGEPNGNKLKSCRQVNSPLGGGCNTSEHPRWEEDPFYGNYGTDNYGFSGLPGSERDNYGNFDTIGYYGTWWSSTEYSSISAWYRNLFWCDGDVSAYNYNKRNGFSVRCIIDEGPPASNFSGTPTSGAVPLTVYFTDQSTNNATSWQWNFGDGDTSTQQNPAHTYQNAGSYTVQLTVANTYGSDTKIKTNYITVTSGGASGEPCPGMPTITDIDDNIYNTVLIGTQCWLKENLKTTTYKNGTPIPNVTDASAWSSLTTGAYVWYDNDINWKDKYGPLYNWYATVDTNGLCPSGWHVPADNEWTALTDYLGGTGWPNGNKLKSCRQVNSPLGVGCNTSEHPRWEEDSNYGNYGTDDYGFSGLPGGYRHHSGAFYLIGYYGYWWSSTEYFSGTSWGRGLSFGSGGMSVGNYNKLTGTSVRCLRDN